MATRAVRLVDVAAEAGVSIASASRALSGSGGISPGAAEHVRRVAADLGYVANAHARSLAGGTRTNIGLIVHEIGDPYFTEIADGVLRLATERGLAVQICHSGRDASTELTQIRTLVAHQVGSIIIAGSGYVDPQVESAAQAELARFQDEGGRVAVVGRHSIRADAVLPDNVAGGRAIAEHLLGLGHRHIAIAAGPRALTTITDRLAGMAEAFAAHGLDFDEALILEAAFTHDGGVAAAEQIVQAAPGTTAIIALNDAMAIGVLAQLRELGLRCPDDIAVTGFDDIAVAAHLGPPLTTVRLPMHQLGEIALSMTLEQPASRPRKRSTGHELVVRGSTGPQAQR